MDTPTTEISLSKRRSNVLGYAFVFALLAFARIFDLSTTNLYVRHRSYESTFAWVVACCFAVVVCWFGTSALRTRFPPAIAILVSMVLGAASTLIVSSAPGMAIGFVIGVVATFDVSRDLVGKSMRLLWVAALPAFCLTVLGGFLLGITGVLRVAPKYELGMAIAVLLCLTALSIVWAWRFRRGAADAIWIFIAFFAVALFGWPCGLQLDTNRRAWLTQIGSGFTNKRMFRLKNYLHGFTEPRSLALFNGITRSQGRTLKPYKNIAFIHVYAAGEVFNSEGFHELDLSRLNSLSSQPWVVSGTTDDVLLALKNVSQLGQLNIPSSDVTDEGLTTLSNKPGLTSLNLFASNINGSGLAHLHAKAPLNIVDLGATKVDDAALKHLSGHMIGNLRLSQTLVSGSGFRDLSFKSLRGLRLDNARFEERYIELLPPSVQFLDISGTELTVEGMKSICKMPRLQSLRIVQTDIDDSVAEQLPKPPLGDLEVDATNLSLNSCQKLAEIKTVVLEFRADALEFDEIIHKSTTMSKEIEKIRRESGLPSKDVVIAIRGLHVRKEMVPALRAIECKLYSATFENPVRDPLRYEYEKRLKQRGFQTERPIDATQLVNFFGMDYEPIQVIAAPQ